MFENVISCRCFFVTAVSAIALNSCDCRSARAIVTSDGSGTHVLSATDDAFGIDHTGVARLSMTVPGGTTLCTGSLLEGGEYVLTAAHCLENATSVSLEWNTDDSNGEANGSPVPDISLENITDWIIHPAYTYNPNIEIGYDLALIDVAGLLPAGAPAGYQINYVNYMDNDLNVPVTKVGYGRTGSGITGQSLPSDGNKRYGRNEYELLTINSRVLVFDFDSGLAVNDTIGTLGLLDLGFGDDEVSTAQGDSGGPGFITIGTNNYIAGVTSYGVNVNGNTDANSESIASWGDLGFDTRVSSPINNNFIMSLTGPFNTLIGDMDFSGFLDSLDIDAMYDAFPVSGPAFPPFDLDGSGGGSISQGDVDLLIEELLQTRKGDANLDGFVNGLDLGTLLSGWGQTNASWAQGDFNGDDIVSGPDLGFLLSNWGFQRETAGSELTTSFVGYAPNPVPEPNSLVLILLLGIVQLGYRQI